MERTHEMFNRKDLTAIFLDCRCTQRRRDILCLSVNLWISRQICAHKDNARIHRRRFQHCMNLTAGMQPNTSIRNFRLQCSLFLQNHTSCRNVPFYIVQNYCL